MSKVLGYAPLWRRVAAMIYDSLLLMAISIGYGGTWIAIETLVLNHETPKTDNVFFTLGWAIVLLSFFCYFWRKAGQTLGMRAWRLKIVKEGTNETPTIPQSLLRCTLAFVGYGLFFTSLFRNDKQCLHDTASLTQTVLLEKEK